MVLSFKGVVVLSFTKPFSNGKSIGNPTTLQVPLSQGTGHFPRQLLRMTMSLFLERLPILESVTNVIEKTVKSEKN